MFKCYFIRLKELRKFCKKNKIRNRFCWEVIVFKEEMKYGIILA